jgi:hypothetical protein
MVTYLSNYSDKLYETQKQITISLETKKLELLPVT